MKKRLVDRKNAKRVDNISGLSQILIDLKPDRCVSDVYINQKMDVTELCKYVDKLKKKGEHITIFHAFMTAIGLVYYNRPYLNRFIANRHIYEHNDIVISFVAKIAFDDNAEEMMILVKIDENDNIHTISKKILDKVDSIRNKKEDKKGANNAIDFLGKLPNIIRIPIVGIFKWCDKMGFLPSSLIEDNLYYSSMIVSNLGTFKTDGIYHNVTDFGTCSGIITIGEIKKEGSKYFCELGISMDERIADGFYFIKSIKLMQYILNNPELLERSINEEVKEK